MTNLIGLHIDSTPETLDKEIEKYKDRCGIIQLFVSKAKKYNKFYDDPAIIQIQINMMCEEIKFIINDDEKYKKFIESYCYNLDLREPKYEKNLNKDYLLEPLFTYMLCAHNNIDRMIKIKNVILTEYKYWIFEYFAYIQKSNIYIQ